ncbi:tetratricopeptide repeat protein [Parasphingopyxis algicola]|uniref:tetratricopeptide repeat protein n=1 Tax=Parasphingopyxis algicola TaxID=2026624 RepID=UPI0015A2C58A|nr:tetratricopeptide repeat protein [Parasphingopyxis algicola]QLC23972.1 tetratricopeptide repeat protein [Parasphingopyxis algicola]
MGESRESEAGKTGGLARYVLIAAAAIATFSIGFAIARGDDQGAAESGAPQGSAQAEAMNNSDFDVAIPRLEARLEANPEDEEGWALLGLSYFQTGRYADAAGAYGEASALNPTLARYHSARGEALALAANGDFPEAAQQAFARALELDPADPRARYFEGVRQDMAGDHAAAIDDWIALLRDTPAGAPWEGDLRRLIAQVSEEEGIDVSGRVPPPGTAAQSNVPAAATQGIPGPTPEQMRSASQLPQGQQEMMIENMVNGLDERLSRNPNDADGWIMLIRSRMQLGQTSQAGDAWRRAREAFAGNSAQLERINASARALGVPGA